VSDLITRPLQADELDLFNRYANPPTSGVGARSRAFDEYVADGQYRPGWVWVAQRNSGEVVARAAFWAPPSSDHPYSLDHFDPGVGDDRIEVGAALLRAAYRALVTAEWTAPTGNDRPDYHLFLPTDWRERPDAHADATDRITAAEKAGLRFFVERINVRWGPESGLPPRSTRLRFEPATDDILVAKVLAALCENTLDAYARRDVQRYGVRRAAELTIEESAALPGGRDWWRLAYNRDGDVVGIVMPTMTTDFATLSYVGVVPAHRGRHYIDDLVIEALHIFTEAGQTLVNDATDVGNTPMAASFERVGYRVVGRRVVMV
jgi:ribosomal protein S18 acetylase RimI-like enzyme